METTIYILALLPLSIISLTCQFLAIIDLFNRDKRELWGGSLGAWSVIILLGSLFGALLYLGAGRLNRHHDSPLFNQGDQI